jgi:hypothetical protein
VTALAAAGDGVCYATTAGGRVERTLSAGADVGMVLRTTPSLDHEKYGAIITIGAGVELSGSTTVLAPGVLRLQARPAGATAWQTVASGDPGATTVSGTETPGRTTRYRLRFVFAGTAAATGGTVAVGVRRRVSVPATTYRLSRHDVYRLRGSVEPAAPGRHVEVWTDRVADHRLGPWHRISLGWRVPLADGRTFVTRRFGTPVRETYHLKIRMPPAGRHLAGWSPRITVIVQ